MKFTTLCTAQWFKRHRAPMIAAAARPVIEPLETRALLSGTFSQLWVDLGFYAPAHQSNAPLSSHKPHGHKLQRECRQPTRGGAEVLQVEGVASFCSRRSRLTRTRIPRRFRLLCRRR